MANISEEEKQQRQYWIKRTYWDYLCAYRLFSSSLRDVDTIFSKMPPDSLLKFLPNFDDFLLKCHDSPKSLYDESVGHVSSPVSASYQIDMRRRGC